MLSAYELGDKMTNKKRATFCAAIKLGTAGLVLDQGYTQEEAAKSISSDTSNEAFRAGELPAT
jgi:hypothetical protein